MINLARKLGHRPGAFLLVLALSLLSVSVAGAQSGGPAIDSISISLWPEFDRVETLVIYRVRLSPETELPAQVTFRLPDYIEETHAIAIEVEGSLVNVDPATIEWSQDGEESLLSFPVESLGIQIEYYDPVVLTREGTERQISYAFTAASDIAAAVFEVQHPVGSANMVVEPEPADSYIGSDDLLYSLVDVAGIAAGDTFDLSATYSRDTDQLSVSFAQEPAVSQPVVPVAEAPAESDELNILYYIACFLGGVVVGWLVCWAIESGRRAALEEELERHRSKPYRRQKPKRSNTSDEDRDRASAATFCHRCGTALRQDADFCHKCGAQKK